MIMKIAVLSNLKVNAPVYKGMPTDRFDELDSMSTMEEIIDVIKSMGHTGKFFEASILPPYSIVDKLMAYKPDLVFNLSEGHFGDSRESHMPSILEMLRIPYTGSRVLTLSICLDKEMTKQVLRSHGIPTAESQVFTDSKQSISPDFFNKKGNFAFPLFVKPNAEGTSMGVEGNSVVTTESALRAMVKSHLQKYQQPILVERFIKGREVLVGMIGNGKDRIMLPILELDHASYGDTHSGVYTNTMKHNEDLNDYHYHCPALLTKKQTDTLQTLAARVFEVLGCLDVSRVDIRLDETDGYKPYVLEINPLPGLTPGFSDLCLEALGMGWKYEELIKKIITSAIKRNKLS